MSIVRTPARVLVLAVALSVAFVALFLEGTPLIRAVVVPLAGMLTAANVIPHLVRSRGGARVVYGSVLVGLTLLITAETLWVSTLTLGVDAEAIGNAMSGLIAGGYLLILVAAAFALVPTARRDPGGMLDAATLAVAAAAALWQAVLAPSLHATGAPTSARAYSFAIVVILSGATGIVAGIILNRSAPRSARPVLLYLLGALGLALAGNVLGSAFLDPATHAYPSWIDAVWPVSYVSAWAALAHPAGPDMLAVTAQGSRRLTSRRLLMLGLAMMITPSIAVVRDLAGSYVDWAGEAVASVVIIVMVLARVAQLAAAHRGAETRLQSLADQDSLTGLANRRIVEQRLDALALRVAAREAPGAAVCFIDLNGFKQVNDTRGHAIGDELLVAIAGRLARLARSGTDDLVGRIGGDEFVVVAEGEPEATADALVARVHRALEGTFALSDGPATASASVGVATARPGEVSSADSLLTHADGRMYQDKRARRRAVAT
ncbi:GGDEF domain-containing protein [Demequina salsinemoris]|uniref:GGDEF domain-containing protein n=1 Tax=Demequina salsinemoris TaxID=577470 RepID=UPI000782CFCB|nr:GGDEF domain-containing protein [Demequina salsinemoris]